MNAPKKNSAAYEDPVCRVTISRILVFALNQKSIYKVKIFVDCSPYATLNVHTTLRLLSTKALRHPAARRLLAQ